MVQFLYLATAGALTMTTGLVVGLTGWLDAGSWIGLVGAGAFGFGLGLYVQSKL